MKVDLQPVFGALRQPVKGETPLIFLVHGFASSPVAMDQLEKFIHASLPLAQLNKYGYDWKQSVLRSGAELADAVFSLHDPRVPVYLVGHSMGGLVCRVANVILADPTKFSGLIPWLMPLGFQDDINFLKRFNFSSRTDRTVNGVVTLATPNSGAMLQGQVSGLLSVIQFGMGRFSSLRHQSVLDLTTDRLFRLLQLFSVSNPILSISGSLGSRFTAGSGQITKLLGYVGLNLTMPHDGVVEDVSVDLKKSVLPNECLDHGSSPYLHLRAYEDCTDVGHHGIHDRRIVADYIVDFVARC
jgi:hypothetical protein